jgi:Papain family cysteine protease
MGIQSDSARSWMQRFASHASSGCAVLILMFGLTLPVFAQSAADDDLLKRGQGLILNTEDDLANVPHAPEYRAFLPDRVDLSDRFPAPGDQGKQNSCVGWSVGYARAYYANRVENRDLSDPANIPSPAYIYDSIRETSQQCDSGSKISDALNLLMRGAVSLKQFPYSEDDCQRPASVVRSRASDFRIANWLLADTRRIDQLKGALTLGHPVIVGLRTTNAFMRLRRGEIYRHPDEFLGHHAITLVGYDEQRQAFKLINSWGQGWADGGFGWIDYDTLRAEAEPRAGFLMRIAVAASPVPSPPPTSVVRPTPPPTPRPAPTVVPIPAPPTVKPTPIINPAPAPALVLECSQVRTLDQGGRRTIVGFVGKDEDLFGRASGRQRR